MKPAIIPFPLPPQARAHRLRLCIRCALLFPILFSLARTDLSAQTVDDGVMLPAKTFFGGYLFTHDSWDHYWEGPLKRTNGNLGTVTTQTSAISANYGFTNNVDLLVSIPYVWTASSQGVLAGQAGWQDLSIAGKYKLPSLPAGELGTLNVFAVPFWSTPLTSYTPDLQPLSIGLDSRKAGVRSTVSFQTRAGWFFDASGAYTWQGAVILDRPYYFTNNQFFETSVVEMPRVVDYSLAPGYLKKGRMFRAVFSKHITQGGADVGDIRRQDLPFVANRFDATRAGGVAMVPLPWIHRLSFRFEYSYVVSGRNVGQSTAITTGLYLTQRL